MAIELSVGPPSKGEPGIGEIDLSLLTINPSKFGEGKLCEPAYRNFPAGSIAIDARKVTGVANGEPGAGVGAPEFGSTWKAATCWKKAINNPVPVPFSARNMGRLPCLTSSPLA